MRSILICDFDDTIVKVDTGKLILDRFAEKGWRRYEDLYEQGRITIEEALLFEFSTVRATRREMLNVLDGSVEFRPGFESLLRECKQVRHPLAVASYGLDFCIKYMMSTLPEGAYVTVRSPTTRVTRRGVSYKFPSLSKGSVNLKDGLVQSYKRKGYEVAYVGDGVSDFPAVSKADVRFAISGSKLAKLCSEGGVDFDEVTNFDSVARKVVGTAVTSGV